MQTIRIFGQARMLPMLAAGIAVLALVPVPSQAQQPSRSSSFGRFLSSYQSRVTQTQSDQPHWITPLVLVTPRLEQEFRSDFVRQVTPSLHTTWNLGNGKGLEFIPERHTEIILNVPPFLDHTAPSARDGFGDFSVVMKERLFSRNEAHGNAIVTAFLAASLPTGKNGNGSCCAVVTPTLAAGKGWGLLAVTSTAGGSFPVSNAAKLGHSISWNNAIQYRLAHEGVGRLFWPELEFNSTFVKGGLNDGKAVTYATPGMVVGRIPLTHSTPEKPGRLGLTLGVGEQIALTHYHPNNHNLIFTVRMPF